MRLTDRGLLALAAAAMLVCAACTKQGAAPAGPPAAEPSRSPVATFNGQTFADPQKGIRRLVEAVETVNREFKPLTDELREKRSRLSKMEGELMTLNEKADRKTLQARMDEVDALKMEIQKKQENGQAEAQQRAKELTDPVYRDLEKALQAFAQKRGISVVLDVSKLGGAMMVVDPSADITDAFVADFNSQNTSAPAEAPKSPAG